MSFSFPDPLLFVDQEAFEDYLKNLLYKAGSANREGLSYDTTFFEMILACLAKKEGTFWLRVNEWKKEKGFDFTSAKWICQDGTKQKLSVFGSLLLYCKGFEEIPIWIGDAEIMMNEDTSALCEKFRTTIPEGLEHYFRNDYVKGECGVDSFDE